MIDHRRYVGGMYDEMGQWQFDFVTSRPEFDRKKIFLDVACGSMRLGRHIIGHLECGNYIGLDMNRAIVEQGLAAECDAKVIANRTPKIIITNNFDTSHIHHFDFAWIHALFNHLLPRSIHNCLTNLRRCAHDKSVIYFTYWKGHNRHAADDAYHPMNPVDFFHSEADIILYGSATGWRCEPINEMQPRGQSIMRALPI